MCDSVAVLAPVDVRLPPLALDIKGLLGRDLTLGSDKQVLPGRCVRLGDQPSHDTLILARTVYLATDVSDSLHPMIMKLTLYRKMSTLNQGTSSKHPGPSESLPACSPTSAYLPMPRCLVYQLSIYQSA